MNTAVAEIDARPVGQNPLMDGFSRLDGGKKTMLGLGVVALIGVVAAFFYFARTADYRVLYANLSEKDGGAVIAQLATLNIPYRYTEGGGAIMVPADKVHDTRLRLASQGLPKGSVLGFEQLDTNRLGMTQFQERLSFQRGLEGELTRSITSLASVADARVHLALPNQNGFFREQQKPSASVLLTLHPGRTLDRAQVAGIVHLVASSVPEMNPKAVSVVDETGALLSTQSEGSDGVDTQKLQYVQQLEQMYTKRILELLEPLVGRENVRAQVTADVDFSLTEQTSEQHTPNQNGQPSTVRSQQLVEVGNNAAQTAQGVAGAVANQPPQPSTAPINGPAAAVNGAGGNPAIANNARRESVVNYEVDKTVRVTRGATGTVRRLSAAVVVNHRAGKDPKGNPITTALPAEEVEKLNALVREAIGFTQQRGDTVNVTNSPFTKVVNEVPEVAWWKQPETLDTARGLAWPLAALALGLMVFMGLIRPALKMMQAPAVREVTEIREPGQQLDAMVDDDTQRPEMLPKPKSTEPTAEDQRLQDAKRLAMENPAAVANIIKNWVNGEAGTAVATT